MKSNLLTCRSTSRSCNLLMCVGKVLLTTAADCVFEVCAKRSREGFQHCGHVGTYASTPQLEGLLFLCLAWPFTCGPLLEHIRSKTFTSQAGTQAQKQRQGPLAIGAAAGTCCSPKVPVRRPIAILVIFSSVMRCLTF